LAELGHGRGGGVEVALEGGSGLGEVVVAHGGEFRALPGSGGGGFDLFRLDARVASDVAVALLLLLLLLFLLLLLLLFLLLLLHLLIAVSHGCRRCFGVASAECVCVGARRLAFMQLRVG